MKLLYNEIDGKIFYAVPDDKWFYFSHSTNIPLTEKSIDEVDPDNKDLCIDLIKTLNKVDASGDAKYYIDVDGDLAVVDGWVEKENPYV